jgi:uncharacterized protein YdeI (YjbR/CyaY-like superfamily)
MNSKNGGDVPLGLGMALMQNPDAYMKFCSFTPERQNELISRTHSIGSPQEMRSFVDHIALSD